MRKQIRFRFPRFRFGGITDNTRAFEHVRDIDKRQAKTYEIIDRAGFQKWVIFVAGAGFLTDAYDIFAVNTVLPMVQMVYWPSTPQNPPAIPRNVNTALLCATLAGSIFGQILFGVLGDLFGRKKMYGWLLVIILWATVGLASVADGSHGSMSITGWFFVWRFAMGFGIGGDYPLSAAIVSEYAPKRHRPAMLATLFFMQPLGQFFATVVAIIVTFCYKSGTQADQFYCQHPECFVAVDRAWRWIIGIGGAPALIAFVIRLQIPESPRYTMDVILDSQKALEETKEYFEPEDDDLYNDNSHWRGGLAPNDIGIGTKESIAPGLPSGQFKPQGAHEIGISGAKDEITRLPKVAHRETRNFSLTKTNETSDQLRQNGRRGIDQIQLWRKGFVEYFTRRGNRIHLLGVCICWFLLDISFYGLGMSSPNIIMGLWNGHHGCPNIGSDQSVFAILYGNAWHSSIVVSLGALIGGVLMIYVVRHSRPVKVQSLFFIVLGIFLYIVGGIFQPFLNAKSTGDHWALVAFYFCCQIFFNLGPNATTFIIPSEQFPTPYRCTCIGLAAASGKLGSVVVQIALGLTGTTSPCSTKLRIPLFVFGSLMILGAIVTQICVPDSRDAENKSISLENLAKGDSWMKDLRKNQWWNRWHTAKPQEDDTDHDE